MSPRRATFAAIALAAALAGPASAADDALRLDVSIAAFDPGVPADTARYRDLGVFPRIREIESVLLPFALRDRLAASGDWGAVRVVPEPDAGAELLVTGRILRSDGEVLELAIRAVDATGRIWVERAFAGPAGGPDVYAAIAAALAEERAGLDAGALETVATVSLLRYASWLAPTAFRGYLEEGPAGHYALRRLPARDDPMLARIRRVRETEFVITDAIDAKFRELHGEIGAVYDVWRAYRRKNLEYQARSETRAQSGGANAPRGSFEALKAQYDNYKWTRVVAQEQDRLAVAFDNEVGHKVEAMEIRVAELEAWVDRKYAEWHRILEALFEAETAIER
ncbi:MAG: hypothetical protein R3176_07750 [Woeseiaceae bacterium]|nr:hypothetical protein [Woeseiaceae bacterium]